MFSRFSIFYCVNFRMSRRRPPIVLDGSDLADDEELPVDAQTDSENDNEDNYEDMTADEDETDTEDIVDVNEQNDQQQQSYFGRDRIEWSTTPVDRPPDNVYRRRVRFHQVNLPRGSHLETQRDAFRSIFSDQIIDIIMKYTNVEGRK